MEKIKSEYSNNKYKNFAPTWNSGEFNLPVGSCNTEQILNTSSNNMKLLQRILLYKFM